MINVEFQMYSEDEPFRRTRYYTSCIDMSILEKGREYYELPEVTVLYITKSDFIGHKKGSYQIHRKAGGKSQSIDVGNGVHERYFNLKYSTRDEDRGAGKLLQDSAKGSRHYVRDNGQNQERRQNRR